MPSSHRLVHSAVNSTTRDGILDLASQKRLEEEWRRVRENFNEPTLDDYRTTVTLPVGVEVGNELNSLVESAHDNTVYSISTGSTHMRFATVEVTDGPSWLKALRHKKEAAIEERKPLHYVDHTATLDELVRVTTASSGALKQEVATDLSSNNGESSPLLTEEGCAWMRCLWLQKQHAQQYSARGDGRSTEEMTGSHPPNTFLENCSWLRSLKAVSNHEPSGKQTSTQ